MMRACHQVPQPAEVEEHPPHGEQRRTALERGREQRQPRAPVVAPQQRFPVPGPRGPQELDPGLALGEDVQPQQKRVGPRVPGRRTVTVAVA